MAGVPAFTENGVLPPGDYRMTLRELQRSSLVLGPGGPSEHPVWDAAWREQLVKNLAVLVEQLWRVGIEAVYVNGSFVEDKDHPNDIDGYFECDPRRFVSGDLERDLNRIDPAKCWTWDHNQRRPYRGYPKGQLPMWHAYRVELYPHYVGLIAGADELGEALEFPAFFRKCRRTNEAKGIVRLIREEGTP